MAVSPLAYLSAAKTAKIVDELGALKLQIANLQEAYDSKAAILKDAGPGEYLGKTYKLTVSEVTRTTLVAELVKGILTPAQIIACSKVSTGLLAVVRAK